LGCGIRLVDGRDGEASRVALAAERKAVSAHLLTFDCLNGSFQTGY
jgi:hypothetical protein